MTTTRLLQVLRVVLCQRRKNWLSNVYNIPFCVYVRDYNSSKAFQSQPVSQRGHPILMCPKVCLSQSALKVAAMLIYQCPSATWCSPLRGSLSLIGSRGNLSIWRITGVRSRVSVSPSPAEWERYREG